MFLTNLTVNLLARCTLFSISRLRHLNFLMRVYFGISAGLKVVTKPDNPYQAELLIFQVWKLS